MNHQRVIESGMWWWRIEHVGDHYCGVVSGMVVCIVAKQGDHWAMTVLNDDGTSAQMDSGSIDRCVIAACRYCAERAR